jgi:hypothetical protein
MQRRETGINANWGWKYGNERISPPSLLSIAFVICHTCCSATHFRHACVVKPIHRVGLERWIKSTRDFYRLSVAVTCAELITVGCYCKLEATAFFGSVPSRQRQGTALGSHAPLCSLHHHNIIIIWAFVYVIIVES